MLTQPTRVFLPVGLACLVLAMAYAAFTGDPLGVVLFLITALVAGVASVTVGGSGDQPVLASAAASESVGAPELAPQPGGGGWPLLGAAAVALLVVAFVVGPLAAFAGLIVAAIAAVGWMARLASEHTGRAVDLLALGLPVVGLLAIASLMFFMSRMLLAVSETASWLLALAVAVLVITTATVVSIRPHMSSRAMLSVLVVGSLLMVGGGLVAAAKGERPIAAHGSEGEGQESGEGEAEAEETPGGEGDHGGAPDETGGEASGQQPAEAAAPVPARVVARDISFDVKTIALKAGAPSRIEFENADDQVPHNVALYETDAAAAGEKIFTGKIITGPAKATYDFKAPPAGTYYFRCDVHPNMSGQVTVA